MFGTNPVRKQELDASTLWVQEVFPTIQGEGPAAGLPALFVRLSGCNLRCHFCDEDFESSTWHPTLMELMGRLHAHCGHSKLVVLTGGEPLRQDVVPLMRRINTDLHLPVQIESAGTLWMPGLSELLSPGNPRGNMLVVSPKTPKLHPEAMRLACAFKYITGAGDVDARDGLPVLSTQQRGRYQRLARPRPGAAVYLQPRDDQEPEANQRNLVAAAQACMAYGHRLTVQMHKLAGLP